MKRIQPLIVFAIVLALAIPALAHKKHDKKHGKRHGKERINISPELKASLSEFHNASRQWTQEQVVPTLLTWKGQFDSKIESADLATLNTLRTKATELRKQRQAIKEKAKSADWIGDKETINKYKEEIRSLREAHRTIVDELKPLITKYSEVLIAMHEEARPTLQSWREARNQRMLEWCKTASSVATTDDDKKFISRMEHRAEHKGGRGKGKHAVVRFLLWDGVSPFEEDDDAMNKPGDASSMGMSHEKAFPNPADAQTSIAFSIPAASMVTITLYDATGNAVSVPVRKSFTAGDHTVEIPTQSLPSGSYRYSVEANGTTKTGTIQVLH